MAHANEFVYRDFPDPARDLPPAPGPRDAVLAGGCFWCTEAVFRQIEGVLDVVAGYAGGSAASANYETVCTGQTGHAEAIRITYDPARVSYGMLLKVFFATAHDPTQLDRQGNDIGTQYRSAIFYADAEEKAVAGAYISQLEAAGVFPSRIMTRLEKLQTFYVAEPHHQDYAARNPHQPYIAAVSAPKVVKTRKFFGERLKAAVAP